jgi:hypothetical protein
VSQGLVGVLLRSARVREREMGGAWDAWLGDALQSLEDAMLLRSLRPVVVPGTDGVDGALPTFAGLGPWDRAGVAVAASRATVEAWLRASSSTGEEWVGGGRLLVHSLPFFAFALRRVIHLRELVHRGGGSWQWERQCRRRIAQVAALLGERLPRPVGSPGCAAGRRAGAVKCAL